jgi:hypothetical protein
MRNIEIIKQHHPSLKYLKNDGMIVRLNAISPGLLWWADTKSQTRGQCVSQELVCVYSDESKNKYPEYFL